MRRAWQAAAVASLVVALTVACDATELPRASPSASASVSAPSTATAAAGTGAATTAVPSAPPTGRPGILARRGADVALVRTETDPTPIRTMPLGSVFSADGSRVAYWSDGGTKLHVMEIAGPDRVLATFVDKRGGGIVWSTDGGGLLVALAEPDARFFIPRTLVAVSVDSGATRSVYVGTGPNGASVVPLVWRRDPEAFVAYETGPGGFSFGYTVITPGHPAVRTEPDGQAIGFAASSDGSQVLGSWTQEGTVKVWPFDDFAKKTELRPGVGERIAQPRWWPGRVEIAFAVGRLVDGAHRDTRVERWDPTTGARAVLKRLADSGNLGAYFIRADGSGLLTQGPYPPGAWEVTDLRTGTTAPVPQVPGEVFTATVLIR